LAPDSVAAPVELHPGDPLDGVAATLFADAEVLLASADLAMIHEFP
jgi:hypothetical protein